MKTKIYLLVIFLLSINLYSQTAEEYFERGYVKAHLKKYEEAIEDYTKAIAINPNYAMAYYNRGIAKNLIGDTDGACSDWRKALSLGLKDVLYFINQNCK